jgi:hypothetical protein
LAALSEAEADAAALGFHVGISIARRLYPREVTLPRSIFTERPFAAAVAKGKRDHVQKINHATSVGQPSVAESLADARTLGPSAAYPPNSCRAGQAAGTVEVGHMLTSPRL